jgi:hypothetical protein
MFTVAAIQRGRVAALVSWPALPYLASDGPHEASNRSGVLRRPWFLPCFLSCRRKNCLNAPAAAPWQNGWIDAMARGIRPAAV